MTLAFKTYFTLTFIGASSFKDITPLVIKVSPAFNPDKIKTEASVLVAASTLISLALPILAM
jgi:hypothetical protein